MWRQRHHDRCTLSGSLSFASAGANQPKRSSSSSFFVFVTAPLAPLPPSPLRFRSSLVIATLLFRPSSSSCSFAFPLLYVCMYIYIYLARPLRDKSRKGVVVGRHIPRFFRGRAARSLCSRCRVCRKHRGSGHSLSRSGSRVQLCRRRGN